MSLLSTVRRELGALTSRDLTGLVKQVTSILPQFSDDAVCEALVQCDEDVERAIELLLSRPAMAKKPTKAKKTPTQQQPSEAGPSDASNSLPQSGSKSKELSVPPSRNLTPLVQKIVEILPRCGEDAAYEALVQAGEDVEKAMVKLLNKYLPVKKPSKASAAESCELEERPKTPAEKEVHKLTKKMREIERIEERLRSGEKVDALQMPKLDKKGELLTELGKAEAIAKVEAARADAEEQKRVMQLREAALQAARELARADQAAIAAEAESRAKAVKEERKAKQLAREEEVASETQAAYETSQVQEAAFQSDHKKTTQTQDVAGMALLSMLHGSRQAGGKCGEKGGATTQIGCDQPDTSTTGKDGKAPRWSDEDILNEYSTPLATSTFTKEQIAAAERIAHEIEEEGGYEARTKGKGAKGKGGYEARSKGKDDNRKGGDDNRGYGKDGYGKDWSYNGYNRTERRDEGGKGKNESKGERDRKGKSKGKGKDGKEGKDGKDGDYGNSPQRGKGKEGKDGKDGDYGNSPQRGKGKEGKEGKADNGDSPQRRSKPSPHHEPAPAPAVTMSSSRLDW